MNDRTYCLDPDCDEQPEPGEEFCRTHLHEDDWPRRRMTRQERLQGMADRGIDTIEERECER